MEGSSKCAGSACASCVASPRPSSARAAYQIASRRRSAPAAEVSREFAEGGEAVGTAVRVLAHAVDAGAADDRDSVPYGTVVGQTGTQNGEGVVGDVRGVPPAARGQGGRDITLFARQVGVGETGRYVRERQLADAACASGVPNGLGCGSRLLQRAGDCLPDGVHRRVQTVRLRVEAAAAGVAQDRPVRGDDCHICLAVAPVDGERGGSHARARAHAHGRCSRLCASSLSVRASASRYWPMRGCAISAVKTLSRPPRSAASRARSS